MLCFAERNKAKEGVLMQYEPVVKASLWEAKLRELATCLGHEVFQLLVALEVPNIRAVIAAAEKAYPDSFSDQNFHMLFNSWFKANSNKTNGAKLKQLSDALCTREVGRNNLKSMIDKWWQEFFSHNSCEFVKTNV